MGRLFQLQRGADGSGAWRWFVVLVRRGGAWRLAGGPGWREGTQALVTCGVRARCVCGESGVVTTAEPEGAAHRSTT